MSYMITSRKNETLLVTSDKPTGNENINSSLQKEEPQMFLQFPLPLPNNMEATTILPNLPHQYISTDGCRSSTTINCLKNPLKLTNTTSEHLPSKVKSVRKKTIAVKKERHSKIHTAQGLRDRRMRLSVHTARKFFDLNDMLGFDKASKTIEWLFSNSKKAIEEVTETLQSDDKNQPPLSACETEPLMEINAAAEHVANLDLQDDVMEDGKHWQLCKADPSVDFEQPQLGFLGKPDNHNMEELSCYPLDYSNINHCVKHLQLDNTAVRSTDAFLGRITTVSATNCSIFDYNKTIAEPPAGWLNSTNTFLGFHGGWDSENSKME